MTRQPFGRWNRQQPHILEIKYDPGGPGRWAACTCGWEGDVHSTTAQADAEAEAHERGVFDVQKAGKRIVRGRVE